MWPASSSSSSPSTHADSSPFPPSASFSAPSAATPRLLQAAAMAAAMPEPNVDDADLRAGGVGDEVSGWRRRPNVTSGPVLLTPTEGRSTRAPHRRRSEGSLRGRPPKTTWKTWIQGQPPCCWRLSRGDPRGGYGDISAAVACKLRPWRLCELRPWRRPRPHVVCAGGGRAEARWPRRMRRAVVRAAALEVRMVGGGAGGAHGGWRRWAAALEVCGRAGGRRRGIQPPPPGARAGEGFWLTGSGDAGKKPDARSKLISSVSTPR